MLRIPARGRHITQEPQTIAEHLLGHGLASFRRRFVAFLVDIALFGLVVGSLFLGLTAWSFHREDPTLFGRLRQVSSGQKSEAPSAELEAVVADVYRMVLERCPQAFPRDLADRIRARDMPSLMEHFRSVDSTIGLGTGKTRTIENEDGTNNLIVGTDLLMGRLGGVLGWSGLFVTWFTLWTLVTRGRSPGKALWRVRVVRLDGRPLGLWDCFSRSGGYSASAATLMLGFLEAIWHPNRQAIHDKIAGTVVVRG